MTSKDDDRVGVALYRDRAGNLHVDIPELLQSFGWADTPENRDMAAEVVEAVINERWPSLPTEIV